MPRVGHGLSTVHDHLVLAFVLHLTPATLPTTPSLPIQNLYPGPEEPGRMFDLIVGRSTSLCPESPSLPENSSSIFKPHFMGDEGVSYLPEALPTPSVVSRLCL